MLTSELVTARVSGSTITPGRVDPDAPALQEMAATLCGLYADAAAERLRRADLDELVTAAIGDHPRWKVARGLAKLLDDRSTFDTAAPVPPAELRRAAFQLARDRGPLALEPGPLGLPVATDLLAELGAPLGLTATQTEDALYADLEENQRLLAVDVPGPEWLLHRYNVAQVQALLLHALSLKIRLVAPTAAKMRQLFRQVKFHRLLHQARRDGDVLELDLDGPTSLFQQSTRYGMALATFFPALLLQPPPWSLEATIVWTRARHQKTLRLDHTAGLVSHHADRGGYQTREQLWFAERFDALESGWTRTEGQAPVALGARGILFPDYRFTRDGRVAHLEILGFWRHDRLAERLALLQQYGPGNVIVAVSRKLHGSEAVLADPPPWVVPFAEVVPAREVLAAVERFALPVPAPQR